jgi:hypothetical protein
MRFQVVRFPRRTRKPLAAAVAVPYRSVPETRLSFDVVVVPWVGVIAEAGEAMRASNEAIIAAAITAARERLVLRFERVFKGLFLLGNGP